MNLNVELKDSVFDPSGFSKDASEKIVRVREGANNRTLYRVWLYLEGNDLPYVDNIVYTLHPTFKDRVFRVARTPANANCSLIIWTWGIFDVEASIKDKKGKAYDVVHTLTFDRQLQEPSIQLWRDTDTSFPPSRPRLKRLR